MSIEELLLALCLATGAFFAIQYCLDALYWDQRRRITGWLLFLVMHIRR